MTPTGAPTRRRDLLDGRIGALATTLVLCMASQLASGHIMMRKVDGWQTLATVPAAQPIDLAA
jgi:hypothetical protein